MEQFNPLKESQTRADVSRQIYEQFMERDALPGLTPEAHAQGYQEFADYLEASPYQDKNGNFHNPTTGSFISKEDAEGYYTYGDNPNAATNYDDLSIVELMKLSADAEARGDKTSRMSVDDVLFDKLEESMKKYADDYVESDGTLRDKSEADLVYERYDKLHKKFLDEAKKRYSGSEEKPVKDTAKTDGKEARDAKFAAADERVTDDKVNNKLLVDGWQDEITFEQAEGLNQAWEKQTGKYPFPVDLVREKMLHDWRKQQKSDEQQSDARDENNGKTGMLALLPAAAAASDSVDDIPDIIVTDDQPAHNTDGYGTPIGPGSLTGSSKDFETQGGQQEKKKKGWKKWLAGIVGVSALTALGIVGYNALNDDEPKGSVNGELTEQEAEDPAATSPVDIVGAGEGIFDDESTDEAADDATDEAQIDEPAADEAADDQTDETPETTDDRTDETAAEEEASEEAQAAEPTPTTTEDSEELTTAEHAEAIIAANDQMQGLFSGLDASAIQVSGDVMPYTNFSNAGAENPLQASVEGLNAYNLAYGRSFQLGEGDMFWEGDHVISPAELSQYNELMKRMAEAAQDNE